MTAPVAATTQVDDHWVSHPEGRLFCRSWTPRDLSPGAPVVLFHDSLGCVELWRDFPRRLAQATGRRVIAYDRLGFGRSDPRSGLPSLEFVAEEATRFFPHVEEQLGIDGFIAFGHSVGGGMAIHCALAFPDRCQGVITESAQVFAEDKTLASIAEARTQFQEPEQVRRLARYHGAKAEWVRDAWTENWLSPGFAAWSLLDVLPGVRCPVLAIHGEQDEYGSLRHPTSIGARVGGRAQVAILPETGHVPHREREEDVLQQVREFLAGV